MSGRGPEKVVEKGAIPTPPTSFLVFLNWPTFTCIKDVPNKYAVWIPLCRCLSVKERGLDCAG